jgi:hypothetical protein
MVRGIVQDHSLPEWKEMIKMIGSTFAEGSHSKNDYSEDVLDFDRQNRRSRLLMTD